MLALYLKVGVAALPIKATDVVAPIARSTSSQYGLLSYRPIKPPTLHLCILRHASKSSIRIGKSRTRMPVACHTALAIAGATPTIGSSPIPFAPSRVVT